MLIYANIIHVHVSQGARQSGPLSAHQQNAIHMAFCRRDDSDPGDSMLTGMNAMEKK